MKILKRWSIGTNFKKGNIFIATIISNQEVDIFYRIENDKYIRFLEEGPKAFCSYQLKNIVSAWDYYSDDELREGLTNENYMLILVNESEIKSALKGNPIKKYDRDYNI